MLGTRAERAIDRLHSRAALQRGGGPTAPVLQETLSQQDGRNLSSASATHIHRKKYPEAGRASPTPDIVHTHTHTLKLNTHTQTHTHSTKHKLPKMCSAHRTSRSQKVAQCELFSSLAPPSLAPIPLKILGARASRAREPQKGRVFPQISEWHLSTVPADRPERDGLQDRLNRRSVPEQDLSLPPPHHPSGSQPRWPLAPTVLESHRPPSPPPCGGRTRPPHATTSHRNLPERAVASASYSGFHLRSRRTGDCADAQPFAMLSEGSFLSANRLNAQPPSLCMTGRPPIGGHRAARSCDWCLARSAFSSSPSRGDSGKRDTAADAAFLLLPVR